MVFLNDTHQLMLCFYRYRGTIASHVYTTRIIYRAALYALAAAQSFYLIHIVCLDVRHHAGSHGAYYRFVYYEWL